MPKWMPTAPEVLREAVIVLAGALLATVVYRYVLPDNLKTWFNGPTGQQPPQMPNY